MRSRAFYRWESFHSQQWFSTSVDMKREAGTWLHSANIRNRESLGWFWCVLVWRGIIFNGRTELHTLDRGLLTRARYCDEVSPSMCVCFQVTLVQTSFLWTTITLLNRSLAVEELLENEVNCRMDWPSGFPDLNPIEHVRDALRRWLLARLYPL